CARYWDYYAMDFW
nr:immunoglobulin heavy chain junction region [Mus musculus]